MKIKLSIIILLCMCSILFAIDSSKTVVRQLANGKTYTLTTETPEFFKKADSNGRMFTDTWFYYGGGEDDGGFVLYSKPDDKGQIVGEYYYKNTWGPATEGKFTWEFYVVDGETLTTEFGEIGTIAEFSNKQYPDSRSVYVLATYYEINPESDIEIGEEKSYLIGLNEPTDKLCGYPFTPASK